LSELDEMPMSAGEMSDVKTFRGKTLDAVLPQIREELGPDAIVLRRREGLAGGVGGFFQRPFVEVEARGPLPSDATPELRNDAATADGLRQPIVQALVEQASPFADALARADAVMAETAGLYGPQPQAPEVDQAAAAMLARADASPAAAPAHADALMSPAAASALAVSPSPTTPAGGSALIAPPPALERSKAADTAEQKLVAAGLSEGLAADVVGEAVAHGLPFSQPRALKQLVRSALARRIPPLADLGPDRRVIAVAGAGGSGKSALIARLAAAYAAADHEVVVVALGSRDGGCALAAELEPLGVSVIAAADAAQAARRLRRREPLVTLVETPPLGAGQAREAAKLAPELRALGCTEVHLALPATISAAAADELSAALAPLGLTHVALTHADETARPGAPVELAIRTRRPLSYVAERERVVPADPAALAAKLLP
jgi:flagellar biosynthesis GTPase FlhF